MALIHLALTTELGNVGEEDPPAFTPTQVFHYAVTLCRRAGGSDLDLALVDFYPHASAGASKDLGMEAEEEDAHCFVATYSVHAESAPLVAQTLERLKQRVEEDRHWAGVLLAACSPLVPSKRS